jgi:hypothetical protein
MSVCDDAVPEGLGTVSEIVLSVEHPVTPTEPSELEPTVW